MNGISELEIWTVQLSYKMVDDDDEEMYQDERKNGEHMTTACLLSSCSNWIDWYVSDTIINTVTQCMFAES